LQLGVVNFHNVGGVTTNYTIRTRSRDLDGGLVGADKYIQTGVARKSGWTKLGIEADAHADGGAVRFYIDDNFVGASQRVPAMALGFVRLGNNSRSYDNFWYDDVSAVPEPSSIALLGLGGLGLVGYAFRRRKAARA
ncbi:MAG: PEP-CTERM sorting domain-containing protein, partial [Planctomycetota bacterium]|nr:PEP-CTERM sorting domain-containing protein [Planctomycetota bacterium]